MKASAVKVHHPQIDAHELTAEMRDATAFVAVSAAPIDRSKVGSLPEPSMERPGSGRLEITDLVLRPSVEPNEAGVYEVRQFMQLYDVDFVEALYRAIMKRAPDPDGFRFYLEGLRSGKFDRVEVLTAFLESAEGKRHNVRVKGLTLPGWVRRMSALPLVGYPIHVFLDLLRLPLLIRRLHDAIAVTTQIAHARNEQIVGHLNAGNRLASESIDDLWTNVAANHVELRTQIAEAREAQIASHDRLTAQTSELTAELNSRLQAVLIAADAQARETTAQIKEIREAHDNLTHYSEMEIAGLLTHVQQLRRELAQQRACLAAFQGDDKPVTRDEAPASTSEPNRMLDAMYVELEDRFRGSREDVKNSQRFYLPLVESAPNHEAPIVDLGCGRGEWLELLREQGSKAIGVETNRVMIDLCRKRGFEVIDQDALAYLRSRPDESLRAVTGFHIIEHMPPEKLIMLFDEITRTLCTGGFVAFETPNPDNLFVSGNYFYFDPSHRHPLPSKLMKLCFESRGFQNVEITPLHPSTEGRFVGNDEVSQRLNDLFYGPMDYAILGWKLDR